MALKNIVHRALTETTGIVAAQSIYEIDFSGCDRIAYQLQFTVTTPAAKNFVDADVHVANNTITEAAHGFVTGLKGQLTTTGVLPAGLSLATDYFVIRVDADTFKLASSLANAQAGTAVDITAA